MVSPDLCQEFWSVHCFVVSSVLCSVLCHKPLKYDKIVLLWAENLGATWVLWWAENLGAAWRDINQLPSE